MLNKKEKIVYLLGAGAMIDFGGPTTNELTEECKDIVKDSVLKDILPLLDETYNNSYNFETIIAVIESALDYAIASQTKGNITINNTSIIRVIFKSKLEKFDSELIWKVYVQLIETVMSNIAKYDVSNNSDKRELLHRYIEGNLQLNKLKIYTLNYDRLIPNVVGRVYDGTYKHTNNNYRLFDYNLKSFLSNKFTYFNLHGSIYLKQDLVKGYYYSVVQSSCHRCLINALHQEGGSPNEKKFFTPIITGYSKSQRIMSEPFNFGFAAFSGDCDTCDKLIIVGYSFSDPHINSVLRNYVIEKNKNIEIVDLNDDYNKVTEKIENEFRLLSEFKPTNYGATTRDGKITVYTKGFMKYMEENVREWQV
ncbi:MAG: SIR2 family protein [Bacteroidales bacterium]|nr:SIR2 family protein [Bacteroidales bacterium]